MKDIFDAKILCGNCNVEMTPINVIKQGFRLRAIQCPKCEEKIIHPMGLQSLNHYNGLKRKTYSVKLRMVGNSHAISIPKEIVEFINEMQRGMSKQMSDIVKLGFEDFETLSLKFMDNEEIKK